MKSKRTKAVLLHILEDIQDIENIIRSNSKEIFQADPILKKAICMSLINIGELTHLLHETLIAKYPEIPWGSVIGLRNRVAHGYHVLDIDVVWDIINNDLKKLKDAISDAYEMIIKTQDSIT